MMFEHEKEKKIGINFFYFIIVNTIKNIINIIKNIINIIFYMLKNIYLLNVKNT